MPPRLPQGDNVFDPGLDCLGSDRDTVSARPGVTKPDWRERDLFFEDLVVRHVDVVFQVAVAWCKNREEAEDLTQVAFIKAFRAFDRFEAGTNFKAWILKILRNAFLDSIRSNASGPEIVALHRLRPDEEPAEPVPAPRTVDLDNKEVFYDLFGDEITRLMHQLPKEFQLAVVLCDVEGLSYQEIAEVLECPVGTVRSRIHRGRAMLQDLLRNYAQKIGYLREAKP